ncbi:hypothetical protein R4282_03315 [Rhodococcus oxybenzonivorans]|uniref:hypothetical protein n=1 Tax=Rhodococcus oxybenzonivorans TaxID=1990687 RepID=UPI002952F497|nr:hypothetical protein [Rhodococcus oxybenzonivorans]MDV7352049.1 hypothetical protein [Rhodococcus oxybenzonivorans]
MNAMQLDVLERVAVDELATAMVGTASANSPVVRNGVATTSASVLERLVELGLITGASGPTERGHVRITPAGVEALAYLAAVP